MLFRPPSTSRVEIWWVICSDSSLPSPLLITPFDILSLSPCLLPCSFFLPPTVSLFYSFFLKLCPSPFSSLNLILHFTSPSYFSFVLYLRIYILLTPSPLLHFYHPPPFPLITSISSLIPSSVSLLSSLPSLSTYLFSSISDFPLTCPCYLHPIIFPLLCHL